MINIVRILNNFTRFVSMIINIDLIKSRANCYRWNYGSFLILISRTWIINYDIGNNLLFIKRFKRLNTNSKTRQDYSIHTNIYSVGFWLIKFYSRYTYGMNIINCICWNSINCCLSKCLINDFFTISKLMEGRKTNSAISYVNTSRICCCIERNWVFNHFGVDTSTCSFTITTTYSKSRFRNIIKTWIFNIDSY